MKTEKEIRLKRLEILKGISEHAESIDKFKKEFDHIPPETFYILDRLFGSLFTACFEVISWVLDESTAPLLNETITVFEELNRVLKGASPGLRDLERASRKTIKEIEKMHSKILEDYKDLLMVDWDELEQ